MNKNVGLRIRLEEKLRDQFVKACNRQDLSASQVLRHFMRSYIESSAREQLSFGFQETTRADEIVEQQET